MKPMIAFSGVRSSWLMLARKRSFARLAFSSSTFFSWSARSARLRSVTSRIELLTSSPSSVSSGTEADLDGKLLAVLAQAVQVEARAHLAHARLARNSRPGAPDAAGGSAPAPGSRWASEQLRRARSRTAARSAS